MVAHVKRVRATFGEIVRTTYWTLYDEPSSITKALHPSLSGRQGRSSGATSTKAPTPTLPFIVFYFFYGLNLFSNECDSYYWHPTETNAAQARPI